MLDLSIQIIILPNKMDEKLYRHTLMPMSHLWGLESEQWYENANPLLPAWHALHTHYPINLNKCLYHYLILINY